MIRPKAVLVGFLLLVIGPLSVAEVPSAVARSQPVTTLATVENDIILGDGRSKTFEFTVSDWSHNWSPGVEVAVWWRIIGRLEEPHYVRASMNGKPIYMMKVSSVSSDAGLAKWSSTDLVQGSSSGLERDGTFEGRSVNFARPADLHLGNNSLEFSLVPETSSSLSVAIRSGTRVLATPSTLPSGQLSADAKFSGGRFKVNATVRHTGLTVASSEVVMLLSASDGEIRRVSQPAGREVTDGQAFDVSFEEVTGEPPKAAYLIYEWSGGSSQPQPIWPHRSVSLLHRLAPPGAAAWTYILAFAVLWVLIPTITRFFRYPVPSRSPNRPSVRMKAIGLASLVVLAAVSAAGFLWLSNPADSLEEVETGSLPRFAEGEPESFARLVTDAVESHEGSAASWKVTQIMPLTSRGETIGCAAFFTVQGDAAANATDERTTERTMLLAVTRTGQLLFYGEA